MSSVSFNGFTFALSEDKAPDYMEVFIGKKHKDHYFCDWNEAEGFIRLHDEDGGQASWAHGARINIDGTWCNLPTEEQAEKIIDLLRYLEGVVY